MAINYAYAYAEIDLETGLCIGMSTSTAADEHDGHPNLIPVPVYSDDYFLKYYNQANGKWYYDAGFTQEWTPPTE